jgi:hypothetical protein
MTAATAEKASVPMSEVRAWAIKNDMSVNATGNLPTIVIEAFNRRHRSKQYTRPMRERLERR